MDQNVSSNEHQPTVSSSNKKTKSSRFLTLFTPVLIVIVAIVILILMKQMTPTLEKKSVEIKAPLVNVIPLIRKSVPFVIASQGNVSANQHTVLTAEVSGKIVQLSAHFKAGNFFKKGQLIAAIDDNDYQIMLLQAKARLAQANAALLEEEARTQQAKKEWQLTGKSLNKAPLLALRKPQLAKAKADVSLAEADIKSAQLKLQRTKVIAPYACIIKSKNIDIAQFVTIGTQLADVIATDIAQVRLPIKQQDIDFLALAKINQSQNEVIPITLKQNHHQWQATLARAEAVVDSQSRVHYVVAELNDPYALKSNTTQSILPIGSFVNAELKGKTFDNVTLIPRRYVIGKNTIYLMDKENKLVIKSFSILRSDQNYLYSQDEFADEHQLITTKLTLPVTGMQLRLLPLSNTPISTSAIQVAN